MDSKQSSNTTKVLMLPWLAQGHMTPFLELAKKLSTKNFHIYLCSTPIVLTSIQNRITKTQSLSIELVPFHLPPTPELPPHRHTTNGLPPHLLRALIDAFEMESPSLTNILKTLSPDLVIYDGFRPRRPTIASSEYNIPAVELITSGAAAVVSYAYHMFTKPGVEFPFPKLHLNPNQMAPRNDRDRAETRRRMESTKISCKMMLFNSFRELEGKYIDYLPILVEKKIIPTGPLVQEITDIGDKDLEILQWLGTKDEQSTVFVSFGSESFLSKEEREEVAHGLELSGVSFVWIVRFPAGERIEVEEALPAEFLKRIGERGKVVEGWAPQAQILAHPSTGGFVSHCGWNSILESLKFGVPIVAVPMHHDQPFNAKLVETVGFGAEVKRDENRRLDRENIAQVIRKVVVDEEGADVRNKAREFSEIIRKKGDEEIDGLVKELTQLCTEGKLPEN
ncbi:beta-D-glucosyl crocetin beta-1,6-glucosyltransferase-like [Rhododendron vialii]|uniref:beta-D-glucosyl crocetin beta-1,6-glucosyltransferase-like n=1 Tax=Rhododendron vialii TaxID=182163 RepID=UPI00265E859C|nr:beta-D-glucosyl crocetin beta-1,6-glucosyltransferase-like [Rhododendron vialii]